MPRHTEAWEKDETWDDGVMTGEDGRLGRVVALDNWIAPQRVVIADDHLCVLGPLNPSQSFVGVGSSWADPAAWRTIAPDTVDLRCLLDDFLRLFDAPDEAIRNYAQRNGMLGICSEHLLAACPRCTPSGKYVGYGLLRMEPILGWRRYADQARWLLTIGKLVRDGQTVPATHWNALRAASFWPEPDQKSEPVAHPFGWSNAEALARAIDSWISRGVVRPRFVWDGTPRLTISAGLFGILGFQIAAAVSGSPGVFFCDACGWPHFRKRSPKTRQRCYCKRPPCQRESRNHSRRDKKDATPEG